MPKNETFITGPGPKLNRDFFDAAFAESGMSAECAGAVREMLLSFFDPPGTKLQSAQDHHEHRMMFLVHEVATSDLLEALTELVKRAQAEYDRSHKQ